MNMKSAMLLAASLAVAATSNLCLAQGMSERPGLPVIITGPLPIPVEGSSTVSGTVDIGGPLPLPVTGDFKPAEPALSPFQASGNCGLGFGAGCTASLYTVPPDKRAVVEYASASVNLPETNHGASGSVRTTIGGTEINHHLPTPIYTPNGGVVVAAATVRLYADPGTEIRMTGGTLGNNTEGNNVFVFFTVSGYLVDYNP